VRTEELHYTFREWGVKGIDIRLNLGPSTVLVMVRLGLRHDGRSTVVKVATGGICTGGNGGVRGVDVVLFVADGSLDPLDILHVGHPDVVSGLAGPYGSRQEGTNISENYKGSGSARPTQSHRLWNVRITQFKKPNAAIAWVAAQTATDR